MAAETFVQQHDVSLMKNDLRVRDVLAYFIICRADLSLIKLTFLQKLMLGIAADTSDGSVSFDPSAFLTLDSDFWADFTRYDSCRNKQVINLLSALAVYVLSWVQSPDPAE